MHELSIAQELLRIIQDEQSRHGFEMVEVVKIKAGGFSGIDSHALEFAFNVVREGTCAGQALLEVDYESIRIQCRQCNHSATTTNMFSTCPVCRSLDIALQGSSHFEIVALEVV